MTHCLLLCTNNHSNYDSVFLFYYFLRVLSKNSTIQDLNESVPQKSFLHRRDNGSNFQLNQLQKELSSKNNINNRQKAKE